MSEPQSDAILSLNESPLAVVERLARALLHTVRGDLSLIQNELSYLSTVHGAGELRTAIARCRNIATQLSQLVPAKVPIEFQTVRLSEILAETGGQGPDDEWSLIGDRNSFIAAFSLLPRLLGVSWYNVAEWREGKTPCIKMIIAHRGVIKGSFSSLSSYVSAEVGERGVVQAAVSDLVLQHLGYAMEVLAREEHVETLITGAGLHRVGMAAA